MPLPDDAYQLATENGVQIRLDAVRIELLDKIDFNTSSGTSVVTSMLVEDQLYILYANQDCIVNFEAVADTNPVAAKAVLLIAGERGTIWLPAGATGFSAIGLTAVGRVYIQRITTWAGLAGKTTLENL